MMLYEFYEEYEDLKPSRQKEGLLALLSELQRDPERYEDLIFDYADIAEDRGFHTGGDEMSNVTLMFETLTDDLDNTFVIYEILDIAADLEADDYFGTEGLDV